MEFDLVSLNAMLWQMFPEPLVQDGLVAPGVPLLPGHSSGFSQASGSPVPEINDFSMYNDIANDGASGFLNDPELPIASNDAAGIVFLDAAATPRNAMGPKKNMRNQYTLQLKEKVGRLAMEHKKANNKQPGTHCNDWSWRTLSVFQQKS